MTIGSLDPAEDRSIDVLVAGSAALLIAKAHKIGERVASGKVSRISDKDGADAMRLMQTTAPSEVAQTMKLLLDNTTISESVRMGLDYLRDLFGNRAGAGISMAQRTLTGLVADDFVIVVCTSYTESLFAHLKD